MKIGLLVPGGVDRSGEFRVIPCLLWLIERLAAGHEVHVFSFFQYREKTRYELLGANVLNIGRPFPRSRMVAAVGAEHCRKPFDVLHAFWAVPAGVVGSAASRLWNIPLVVHVTGGDLASVPEIGYGLVRTRRGRMALRWAVSGAARVTVPSEFMQRLASDRGIEASRLPLGVALDRWPPRPPRRREPGAPARLIHVGSLNTVKGQSMLLEVTRVLRDDGIRFHLDIVGPDTLDGRVQRLAAELGVSGHVTFHGFVPNLKLRDLVEAADLLLITSYHEADPVVLLEAAAAGVPAVSTMVGHSADWSPDAAVVVDGREPAVFAANVAALLADEERRRSIAAKAQARAVAEDADWTFRALEELYRTVARGSPRSRARGNA